MPRVSGNTDLFLVSRTTLPYHHPGCSWLFDNHPYRSRSYGFLESAWLSNKGFPLRQVDQQFTCFHTAHSGAPMPWCKPISITQSIGSQELHENL